MMKLVTFEKRSIMTGNVSSMTMLIHVPDYYKWKAERAPIQDAMPYLTNNEREFLLTGITPKEWAEAFGNDEAQ